MTSHTIPAATAGLDRDQVDQFLVEAAEVAGRAPSIHNTQPWLWRVNDGTADLYAEPRRQLLIADPQRRLLTLSCGAALHHARVALAGHDIAFDLERFPDADNHDHLARIAVTGRAPASPAVLRMFQTLDDRHTDRRPLLDTPVPATTLAALREVVTGCGADLQILHSTQVIELAAATGRAQRDETGDSAALAELRLWIGSARPTGAGIPDVDIPEHRTETTVPSRDFGHVGTLRTSTSHDTAATYAVLYGDVDGPGSWLRAGEALSALWLTATRDHIAVLPLSATVEQPATRQWLRQHILSGISYPYLAVRIGVPDPDLHEPPRTPRLPLNLTVTA